MFKHHQIVRDEIHTYDILNKNANLTKTAKTAKTFLSATGEVMHGFYIIVKDVPDNKCIEINII